MHQLCIMRGRVFGSSHLWRESFVHGSGAHLDRGAQEKICLDPPFITDTDILQGE